MWLRGKFTSHMWLTLFATGYCFSKSFSPWCVYVAGQGRVLEGRLVSSVRTCIILGSQCPNHPKTSHSITPAQEDMTLFKKDYLRLSVFPCPVILQRKYIYKALMPGSSLIFLKIWVRDGFCDWAQNESCSFMPSSKQVVLCTTLFIRWVWEPKQRKKKRERMRGKNS